MVNLKSKSDAQIVKMALSDDKYFVHLVERYEAKLMRYVKRISAFDTEMCEDVLQEVFVKVYRNLNDFDSSFSFSSWIYRITHNEVVSLVRKMKARPQVVSVDDEDVSDFVERLPGDTDVLGDLTKKELAECVREALAKLPEKYRDVLMLRYLEDKSYQEIGDILKRNINSVSVLINRGKEKLKNQLINSK